MIKIDFIKKKRLFAKNNMQPDPNFYWMIIFCACMVLIIAALIFDLYTFTKINKDDASNSQVQNQQLDKVSAQRIEKILQVFADKEEASSAILNSQSSIVDPSL